jgi:pyruvate formate lyase activating enzyme
MRIKGFIGTSLIDYPKTVSCVVFLGKCNFSCPFCHNYEIVLDKYIDNNPDISKEEIIKKISDRANFIEGVVITGGEPTLNDDLIDFMSKIKSINSNLKIKLDTNGSNPDILKKIIDDNLVDYIALDIKSSEEKYQLASTVKDSFFNVFKSIDLLKSSDIEYEFRTTVVPKIVEREDIIKISEIIKGCKRYALQQFNNENTLDTAFRVIKPYPNEFFYEVKKYLEDNFGLSVTLRLN